MLSFPPAKRLKLSEDSEGSERGLAVTTPAFPKQTNPHNQVLPNSKPKALAQNGSAGGGQARAGGPWPRAPKPAASMAEITKHQQSLPIYTARQQLINEIKENKSLVIIGETGSGKTTQLPQYIWADILRPSLRSPGPSPTANCIAITQPRRLAATTTAARVALEMNVPLGSLVGYSVRFDDKTSAQTRVKFVTDGMLLREAMVDPELRRYSTVLLDEAHERSINTDILCALLARMQRTTRPDLRVIVMSATLDADLFQRHFQAKVLYVQGRQYPVEVKYTATPEPNYVEAMILAIVQIHLSEESGDILAFLTGREEIEAVTKVLREKSKLLPTEAHKLIICPLYAAQTDEQQQLVFKPTEANCRKVVIATNIAETSLTVPNIRFVVDCGLVKVKQHAPRNGTQRRGPDANILAAVPISKEQAWQRAGRAGRTGPGKAFRLYTEKSFASLRDSQVPEIHRVDLTNLILQLLVIGITDVVNFPYIQAPELTAVKTALESLLTLEALDRSKALTDLGRQMAAFPLEPRFTRVLIKSKEYNCANEVLSIVAMLSVENLFTHDSGNKNSASKGPEESSADQTVGQRSTGVDAAKKTFGAGDGDHMFLLAVCNGFLEAANKKEWAREHFVNKRSIEKALEVRKQLVEYWEAKWPLEASSFKDGTELSENVRKSFLAGFFQNTAARLPNGHYESVQDKQEVFVHPSSALFGKKPQFVIFTELVFTSKFYMRHVSPVEGSWLTHIAPMLFRGTQAVQ